MTGSIQTSLFPIESYLTKRTQRSGTFVDNMKLPVHRWFRYSAGFSAEWVQSLVSSYSQTATYVLDPFAGSGTTLIACDECKVPSIGVEAHPFITRIAQAKLLWNTDADQFGQNINVLVRRAREIEEKNYLVADELPPLLGKVYSQESIRKLECLRFAWQELSADSSIGELEWLAITSILRPCSHAGTAPWQYILPNKKKARSVEPYRAIQLQRDMMVDDMKTLQSRATQVRSTMLLGDARTLKEVKDGSIDMVITSPPYTNNYDYADATRLEMTFWREVERWKDLQEAVRRHLVRSSSQHAAAEKLDLDTILGDSYLEPILDELEPICRELEEERHLHRGKKQYHLMVAAYFSDMARVWKSIFRVCKPDASVVFVLGDSAPYGLYVPVSRWHAALAHAAGFSSAQFTKLRDRNIKWQNRTHSVLLSEGELWVNNREDGDFNMERTGSPSHKLGQMIGNFFENLFFESLKAVADRRSVYCDAQGLRPNTRGNRKKVTWNDDQGTPHDLDYVLERGGSANELGQPVAFIELAWRRYTKHSRNKAGEIEGALIHLGRTYPGAFLGAILAGEWSSGSLEQMEIRGINILHIPFEVIAKAFATKGIDLRYDEKSADSVKWAIIEHWERLSTQDLKDLSDELSKQIAEEYRDFLKRLEASLERHITEVRVLFLYGQEYVFASIAEAIAGVRKVIIDLEDREFVKFEIQILFSNSDKIQGTFHEQQDAVDFLAKQAMS